MPDLTLILFVVAGLAVAGAVVFILKSKKGDSPALPITQVPDVAVLQAALNKAIDKLHQSAPVSAPVSPAPVSVPAPAPAVTMAPDGTAPIGITAPTWQAPPPPWPIDARYLNANQIAALTPEETGRANMWQQALMSAAMTGNGQNPVPAALLIFRAGFTKQEDLNKPLDETWQRVFAAYGVTPPSPQAMTAWDREPHAPHVPGPGEAAYDVRLQR